MNMSIQEIIDNFDLMGEWEERYQYLLSLANKLPPMDESLKTDTAKVKGCMSQVWMVLGWDEQKRLTFMADSDAMLVKGLIFVLASIVSQKTAKDIQNIDIGALFSQLGLETQLSPNRRNGFFSMVERVKGFCSTAQ